MPNPPESPFSKMPKEDLAAWVGKYAQPGSLMHEQLLATISVRCAGDLERALKSLEDSQNRNAAASDRLGQKVFWLNVVLATATVIGTLIAIAQVFHIFREQ
jgi:hypothetical protein